MHAARAGLDLRDLVDHIHPVDHLAEHAVTVMLGGRSLEVQEVVVHQIDEELGGRAVDHVGAGHRQRAALVRQLVGGFILDRIVGFLLRERAVETAALSICPVSPI